MRNREIANTAEVLKAKSLLDKLTHYSPKPWVDSEKIVLELQELGWDAREFWKRCAGKPASDPGSRSQPAGTVFRKI